MGRWDPWRGCHRCSEGCKFCYIHKGDAKRGIDTNTIVRNKNFYRLIEKKKNGEYKTASGLIYLCFYLKTQINGEVSVGILFEKDRIVRFCFLQKE